MFDYLCVVRKSEWDSTFRLKPLIINPVNDVVTGKSFAELEYSFLHKLDVAVISLAQVFLERALKNFLVAKEVVIPKDNTYYDNLKIVEVHNLIDKHLLGLLHKTRKLRNNLMHSKYKVSDDLFAEKARESIRTVSEFLAKTNCVL